MVDKEGMVLEVKNGIAHVLTQQCAIIRLPVPSNVQPGMTLQLTLSQPMRRQAMSRPAWYAAIAVMTILIVLATALFLPAATFAWVSIDVNPSVEFAIDGTFHVMTARPLNADATRLLRIHDYSGLSLEEAVHLYLEDANTGGEGMSSSPGPVLLAMCPNPARERWSPTYSYQWERMAAHLRTLQVEAQWSNGPIYLLDASESLHPEASRLGLTIGRYALMKSAGAHGPQLTASDAISLSLTDLIDLSGKRTEIAPQDTASMHESAAGSGASAGRGVPDDAAISESPTPSGSDDTGIPYGNGMGRSDASPNTSTQQASPFQQLEGPAPYAGESNRFGDAPTVAPGTPERAQTRTTSGPAIEADTGGTCVAGGASGDPNGDTLAPSPPVGTQSTDAPVSGENGNPVRETQMGTETPSGSGDGGTSSSPAQGSGSPESTSTPSSQPGAFNGNSPTPRQTTETGASGNPSTTSGSDSSGGTGTGGQ